MKTLDWKDIYKTIVTRAWEDENFKKSLIANPLESIESITSEKIDFKEKKIIIEDQTDKNTIYLNIPQKVDFENIELTEEQLEEISGGGFFGFLTKMFFGKV